MIRPYHHLGIDKSSLMLTSTLNQLYFPTFSILSTVLIESHRRRRHSWRWTLTRSSSSRESSRCTRRRNILSRNRWRTRRYSPSRCWSHPTSLCKPLRKRRHVGQDGE